MARFRTTMPEMKEFRLRPDPMHTPNTTVAGNGAGAIALDYESKDPASLAQDPIYLGLSLTAWIKIAVVTILMGLTFRYNLVRLWAKTNPFYGEPNWRHAICIPLIGIYYLFVNRDEVLAAPVRTNWSGLGILFLGILLFVYGIYPGQNDFVKDFGMIVALFGVVVLLAGWKVVKVTWFPIVFLICAIPWPDLVYSKVASPLQHLAASVAVGTLRYTGVDAFNTGTKIIISHPGQPDRTLNVAEACAGLRSLMTFISVAGAVAFLSVRVLWQKAVITVSAVPIAVFCNVMRVSGQGLLDHYISQELAEGFAHQFVGIIMLIPGFFLILLTGWVLDRVFIEQAGNEKTKRDIVRVGSGKAVSWNVPGQQIRAKEPRSPAARAGRVVNAGGTTGLKPKVTPANPPGSVPQATTRGVAVPPGAPAVALRSNAAPANGSSHGGATRGASPVSSTHVTPPRPVSSIRSDRRSTVPAANTSHRLPPNPVARPVNAAPAVARVNPVTKPSAGGGA